MPLIEPGRKAPVFSLRDQHGSPHHLKDYLGRPVVLYFYPKDDTPGCTAEACDFRDRLLEFERLTGTILGVSPDSEASHAAFAGKHRLPFPLLADTPGRDGTPKVADKYGVWTEKSLYGRRYMGVVRTTYLVDEAGRVARRWDRVNVAGHAEEVHAAMRELRRGVPLLAER